MKPMSLTRFVGPLALAALVFSGFGCTSYTVDTDASGNAVGGKATYSTGEGEGKVVVRSDKKLPDGWPKDFPIMGGMSITNASSATQGTGFMMFVEWSTKASMKEAFDYYVKELPKHGFDVASTTSLDGIMAVGYNKKGDLHYAGSVSMTKEGNDPVLVSATYLYTKDLSSWGSIDGAPLVGDDE